MKSNSEIAPGKRSVVVFCDIGDILGAPVFSPPPPLLKRLDVFPFVAEVLTNLKNDGVRLGIISDTGDETPEAIDDVLQKSGLAEFFESELLIYSSKVSLIKNSPEIFRLAAEKAGLSANPEQCIFVGEDPRERSFAAQAGFLVGRDISLLGEVLSPSMAVNKPDISNLSACIEDARRASLDTDPGPDDPTNFRKLIDRLQASETKLPPLYRETVFTPFINKLKELGPEDFGKILLTDSQRISTGGVMIDIAHAILQHAELFNAKATDAFDEVISDLYDGFLSAQDRKGIKVPDIAVVAPLVKWGNPIPGPYTWPVDATNKSFNILAAIVNMPPSNARHGLFAWSTLGHETAGHDILHANEGLPQELSEAIQVELKKQNIGFGLAEYWSSRIDETASDVLGILNMGPAAGIGLIGYFRGLSAALGGMPKLRSEGPRRDSHPADILRGYLAASTVRLLSFNGASAWANFIEDETNKDLDMIRLGGIVVSPKIAQQSAEIVAGVLVTQKCKVLQNHALINIQDWRNQDEEIVSELRQILAIDIPLSVEIASGVFAAHVVSAAVMEALSKDADIAVIFDRMITILKAMHDKNPSWGPLFIYHPSSISRDLAYRPNVPH